MDCLLLACAAPALSSCLRPPAVTPAASTPAPGTAPPPATLSDSGPSQFGQSSAELLGKLRLGWNLGNSLDAPEGETAWGNPKTTPQLLSAVAKHGFRLVRIPVTWTPHTELQFIEQLPALITALDERDQRAFKQATIELGMAKKPQAFDFDHHFQMLEHLHRPLLSPRFRFSRDYVQAGLQYNGPRSPNARQLSMPPAYVWVARLQWGLWSLLARLGAELELRELFLDLLSTPVTPLMCADDSP